MQIFILFCGPTDAVADNLILGSGLDGEGDGDYDEEEAMMLAERGKTHRPERIYEDEVEDEMAERRAEELADHERRDDGQFAAGEAAKTSRSVISFSPEDYEISGSTIS